MERTVTLAAAIRSAGLDLLRCSWRFSRAKPLSGVAALVVALAVTAVFSGAIATHAPNKTAVGALREAPSSSHLMGTDDLGRNVFSRIVFGTRISL